LLREFRAGIVTAGGVEELEVAGIYRQCGLGDDEPAMDCRRKYES
jgi:hypothetical protein